MYDKLVHNKSMSHVTLLWTWTGWNEIFDEFFERCLQSNQVIAKSLTMGFNCMIWGKVTTSLAYHSRIMALKIIIVQIILPDLKLQFLSSTYVGGLSLHSPHNSDSSHLCEGQMQHTKKIAKWLTKNENISPEILIQLK